MTTETTSWQRIERVMGWAGLNSAAFASVIGLSTPQTLYQIKAGKNGISREVADRITTRFAEISLSWLLTGDGTMLRPTQRPIPSYNADCTSLAMLERLPEPDQSILLPDSADCDLAARTFSAAMSPEIQQGSIVVLRRIEPQNIVAGGIYLIAASGGTAFVRRVKSVESTTLLLSAAAANFEDISFDRTLVKRAYLVKFSIKNHSI